MTRIIKIEDIPCRPYTHYGVRHQPEPMVGHHAEIVPGVSIRIHGVDTNRVHGPEIYDRTFKIGDEASYGSFNLFYFGKIVAIGAKTVTIETDQQSKRVRRLDISAFSDNNRNDPERKHTENANWMD